MARTGRPSAYRDEYAEQARKLCLLGATDAEMADILGVSEQTFNAWKKQFPDFLESLQKGKAAADADVADRLYQRAMGYSHDSVKIMTRSVGDGESVIEEVPFIEHYPPDTGACIFWLKNRQRGKWRDKIEQEVSGPGGSPLVPVLNVQLSSSGSGSASEADDRSRDKRD